jgi:hypothetical protein
MKMHLKTLKEKIAKEYLLGYSKYAIFKLKKMDVFEPLFNI